MPRESVYGSELPYGEEEPARSVVEVSWSREAGHVQMATKCIRADDESDYLPRLEPFPTDALPSEQHDLGEATAAVLVEMEGLARNGHYVQLDRHGINDLIRYLRRARDQAFGRDE